MPKDFKEYNVFEKIWKSRYYICVPYNTISIWIVRLYVKPTLKLSFKHIFRIVIRDARFKMGKRNYR